MGVSRPQSSAVTSIDRAVTRPSRPPHGATSDSDARLGQATRMGRLEVVGGGADAAERVVAALARRRRPDPVPVPRPRAPHPHLPPPAPPRRRLVPASRSPPPAASPNRAALPLPRAASPRPGTRRRRRHAGRAATHESSRNAEQSKTCPGWPARPPAHPPARPVSASRNRRHEVGETGRHGKPGSDRRRRPPPGPRAGPHPVCLTRISPSHVPWMRDSDGHLDGFHAGPGRVDDLAARAVPPHLPSPQSEPARAPLVCNAPTRPRASSRRRARVLHGPQGRCACPGGAGA